jgi:hypothetical protein
LNDSECLFTHVPYAEQIGSITTMLSTWEYFASYQGTNEEFNVYVYDFPTFLSESMRISLGFDKESKFLTYIGYVPLEILFQLDQPAAPRK